MPTPSTSRAQNAAHPPQNRHPLFRDPVQLVTDFLFLIFTLAYVPLRNTLYNYFQKPKSLKDRICLVTGSGRGLGREICLALARDGAILACADINEENNKHTVQMLHDMNVAAIGYKVNIANKQEVEEVVKKVETDLGPIYLLVNNAGIIMPSSEPTEEYVRAIFNVNTLGAIWMTGAVLPLMKKRNSGHIVNISSISALYGTPILSAYGASKAALSNYSQSLRLELSFEPNNRIHVTCVHPDVINTSEDYIEMLNKRITAQDVTHVVADILYAIKYNKTDISTPSFYYYLYALNVLFPSEVIHKFIKLMDVTFKLPNPKEWNQLPVADIVRTSNYPPPTEAEEVMKMMSEEEPHCIDRRHHQTRKERKISFTTAAGHNHSHGIMRQRSTTSERSSSPVEGEVFEFGSAHKEQQQKKVRIDESSVKQTEGQKETDSSNSSELNEGPSRTDLNVEVVKSERAQPSIEEAVEATNL